MIQTSFIDIVTKNIPFIINEYIMYITTFLNDFLLCYFYDTFLLRFVLYSAIENVFLFAVLKPLGPLSLIC